ncbi:family 3 CoA transferase [Natronomonas pharaonis DSM 2160]|uniref:Family 3 CoA transferase n=1 Tax=Natronomonas pharaonis (strain ATCC 35678 / DSM 2160 / CIP 103997 / JCM 8858 / NBRC 14720 / NCIMB 2260 / Gabara) TaxID=348780 RepID=A0A1U7EYA1_NATPD|nr:CaiB/BaiF CoA-transferase family protein [Natronomonas pharaonis]CAI50196.2 family 3 CoA transferase [Natronomonas pharaonis DSM 2160]
MRLDGVRVLDLTRLLPGPYATQLLADAGADVVKVEDTDAGDYARHMPPLTDDGVGAVFDAVNRGKRSVAIDLKTDAGREAFYALVDDADVVIESFRPGVAERLGVDYGTLSERQPDLVYCSLTGYGQSGPYADRAGHDLNYVGIAGLLDMTRRGTDEAPRVPGYQVADMAGGLLAAFGIVSALLSRELGNTDGEYLDVALTDAVVSFSQALAPEALAGEDPRPGETPLAGAYPWYDVYETADGRYVTLGALEPQFWEAFCDAVDRPDLVEAHMTDDDAERAALRETLADIFGSKTREEWIAALDDVDAAVEAVYTPDEALEHPQIEARGYIDRPADGQPRVGFPLRGSAVPTGGAAEGDVPGHGEHTDTLLAAAGLSDEKRARLNDDGVVR